MDDLFDCVSNFIFIHLLYQSISLSYSYFITISLNRFIGAKIITKIEE